MKIYSALVFASVVAVSAYAMAEDEVDSAAATSTTKIDTALPNMPELRSGEADVDEVITNRKLRAETGSKSKYSFSTSLNYNGGTVKDPGSEVRPNIGASSFVPIRPALSGLIGAKYKISSLQSLAADVGLTIYKPFHSDAQKSFRQRSTVANPSLTYQVVYQASGIQNVTAITGSLATDDEYRAIGQVASVGLSQTMIYDFGGSIFSVGLAGEVSYSGYDKDVNDMTEDGSRVGESQSDYAFALYPFAELNLSDRFNLRTVARPFIFEHLRSEPFGNVKRNVYTQSFGLGISVARDVFLYPNVQFAPEDLRADRTNVGLQLNLNI